MVELTPAAMVLLGAHLAIHGVETLADWLDMRRLRAQSPAKAADIYDDASYARMQRHQAAATNLGMIESSAVLAVLAVFWLAGGFGWLAETCATAFGMTLTGGLVFTGLLFLGARLVRLPFALYHTFVVEQRFGFNKRTPLVFFIDEVKSLFLTVVLGGGLFAVLSWVMGAGGTAGWLVAWVIVVVSGALLVAFGPALILPFFNSLERLPEGPLRDGVTGLAAKCGFPAGDVLVMDGSRRSSRANAFLAGLGRGRRIVLFDTLVTNHDQSELMAILAHEIGHWKLQHLARRLAWSAIMAGAGLWLASWAVHQPWLYRAFGVAAENEAWVPVGLVLFSIAISPLLWLTGILASARSRRHEYEADAFAVKAVNGGDALSKALIKLSRDNLANLDPHPLVVGLHFSHPPLRYRLRAIECARRLSGQ